MTRVWWFLAFVLGCAPRAPASVNTDAVLMSVNVPRIPKQVAGIMGPIHVQVVARIALADSSIEALGAYVSLTRTIYVRADMPLLFQWAVLAHEECHAALMDYGLGSMPMPLQQQVCDAMGAARVAGLR